MACLERYKFRRHVFRLCTNAEAEIYNEELDVSTSDAHDDDSISFVHFKFVTDDQSLVSHVADDKDATYSLIDLATLVQEQLYDPFCLQIGEQIYERQDIPGQLSEDKLFRNTTQSNTIICFPKSLQQRVVQNTDHTQISGHPDGRRMRQYLRQQFCRHAMSVDAYNVVRNHTSTARECINLQKHVTDQELLPATEPLAYVSIDIIESLLESSNGNKALLLVTNCLSKLSKTVPLRTTTTHCIFKTLTKHCVLL